MLVVWLTLFFPLEFGTVGWLAHIFQRGILTTNQVLDRCRCLFDKPNEWSQVFLTTTHWTMSLLLRVYYHLVVSISLPSGSKLISLGWLPNHPESICGGYRCWSRHLAAGANGTSLHQQLLGTLDMKVYQLIAAGCGLGQCKVYMLLKTLGTIGNQCNLPGYQLDSTLQWLNFHCQVV